MSPNKANNTTKGKAISAFYSAAVEKDKDMLLLLEGASVTLPS